MKNRTAILPFLLLLLIPFAAVAQREVGVRGFRMEQSRGEIAVEFTLDAGRKACQITYSTHYETIK